MKARTKRLRRESALGLVLSWLDEAIPKKPRVPWDYDDEDHLYSITQLQTCCKALPRQSHYVTTSWRLLLISYEQVTRYMGEFDSDPRWIESELQRVKTLRTLGPKVACSTLIQSMTQFKDFNNMIYAIGGGQGGLECFGCVLHNNQPGKTPDPRYGAWIEKEMRRLEVIHWIICWCPGLRSVLPDVWGLGMREFLMRWFDAIPVGPKRLLRSEWSATRYWDCLPAMRIRLQDGEYAYILNGRV